MKKILFLDIDGVVNSRDTTNFKELYPLDQHMAFMVGKIQLDTDCEVVLSSSWRHHPDGIAAVEKRIVKVIDITPTIGTFRGREVNQWLVDHGQDVERYAILDDDSDFWPWQPLFKTTFQSGLTEEIAKQVTDYLNGGSYERRPISSPVPATPAVREETGVNSSDERTTQQP